MLILDKSLAAWGAAQFEAVLKDELARHADELPLQKALSYSSAVGEAPISVIIERVSESERAIRVKTGIFFEGVCRDCSCVDDPSPEGVSTEYCELQLDIEKGSAATTVTLLEE